MFLPFFKYRSVSLLTHSIADWSTIRDSLKSTIVAGALLGTLAGSEIGRRLDEADRMKMGMATSDALNNNKIGTSSRWQSDRSDIAGAVTPTRDYTDENGNYCREIKQTVVIGGETQQETGQACREKDGSWSLS